MVKVCDRFCHKYLVLDTKPTVINTKPVIEIVLWSIEDQVWLIDDASNYIPSEHYSDNGCDGCPFELGKGKPGADYEKIGQLAREALESLHKEEKNE